MKLRWRPLFALLLVPALLVAGPAWANPLPDAIILTHVQPYDGNPPPVSQCLDIVQHTSAEGELEFDLYLRPLFAEPPYGVTALEVELEWPDDWSWVGYEVPHEGFGNVSVGVGQALLDLHWPGFDQGEDEVLLMFRCVLQASSHGDLDARFGYGEVTADCWGSLPLEIWMYGATAGVTCDWCDIDCSLGHQCIPSADTDELDLVVVEGGALNSAVDFHVNYVDIFGPCSVNYSSSEDWLTFTVEVLSETDHHLTLTADSDGLDPGTYSAWLSGTASCVACTRVNLEVLATTATESISLSAVKSRY